jgi:hypothetical protein
VGQRADDQSDPEKLPRMLSGASMTWMTLRTIPLIAFSALRA